MKKKGKKGASGRERERYLKKPPTKHKPNALHPLSIVV